MVAKTATEGVADRPGPLASRPAAGISRVCRPTGTAVSLELMLQVRNRLEQLHVS
jgi:hypothetical protein